ncbi:MAG TPA: hypothetical protein VM012_08505, partial [Flavitalea sp.]|nr:hypothetical protein [Flavitalea sp.]
MQNSVLLVASYFFYAWWDYRFLLLLILSTVLDYLLGLTIARQHSLPMKKIFLWISVVANVSVLIYFKYFNFFIDSFSAILVRLGIRADFFTLSVILPLGISFYTFHGLSYVFDVYRNKIKPVNNPVAYALFVSFFPLLVAGPIERATHLLPQLLVARKFNYGQAADGLKQFLWG